MNKSHLITITLGIWLSVASVVQFVTYLTGRYIYEPNRWLASGELVLAILVLSWFVYQFIKWLKGIKERKDEA